MWYVRSDGHIESGDFSEQMEVRDNIEVEQISDAINSMLTKVQNLEDSRQEFVSNVSHELKTPITSIKVLAESLTMQGRCSGPNCIGEFMEISIRNLTA